MITQIIQRKLDCSIARNSKCISQSTYISRGGGGGGRIIVSFIYVSKQHNFFLVVTKLDSGLQSFRTGRPHQKGDKYGTNRIFKKHFWIFGGPCIGTSITRMSPISCLAVLYHLHQSTCQIMKQFDKDFCVIAIMIK